MLHISTYIQNSTPGTQNGTSHNPILPGSFPPVLPKFPPPGCAEESLDLYVVGGYLGKSCAEDLTSALFSALDESRRTFRVILACMARLNSASTRASVNPGERHSRPSTAAEAELQQRAGSEVPGHDGWLPRQTALAVDLASGRAYPVRFEGAGRGPGWAVRSSRVLGGSREEALTEVGGHERECFLERR